jgi:hypothetical protein
VTAWRERFAASLEHGFDLHHYAHARANVVMGDEHLGITNLDGLKAKNDG